MSKDIFQMKTDHIVERFQRVLYIHDNLCIYGNSENKHGLNLINLMQTASTNGLAFNSRKCKINTPISPLMASFSAEKV